MFQESIVSSISIHKYAVTAFCSLIILIRAQHIYFQTQVEGSIATMIMCIVALLALHKPSKLSFIYLVIFLLLALAYQAFAISLQLENDGIFHGWNWLGLLGGVLVLLSIGPLLASPKVRGTYLTHA